MGTNETSGVKFIDIAGVNCWIVYLSPCDSKETEIKKSIQDACIKNKLFGMGWRNPFFEKYVKKMKQQL